jgi:threonine dehydratase
MDTITYDHVREAADRLKRVAHRTPVMTSRTLNRQTGREIYLKCEQFQRGGAFKFRGAYNTIAQLTEEEKQRGVLAYSSGNHAQGVALAARLSGVPAVICMPTDAPPVKLAATRETYGAEVLTFDRLTTDREAFGRQVAEERGLTIVPPFDHPHIMAGAGTAALELLEEVPDLDAVIAPIGGGGLLSGTSIAAHGWNPKIRVFGAEPALAADTYRSFQAGARVSIDPPSTMADGLRATTPGALTFPILQSHVENVVLVTEEEIADAVRFALIRLKTVIEPSAAVALAAVRKGALPRDCRKVGVILSGGNIDPSLLLRLWQRETMLSSEI